MHNFPGSSHRARLWSRDTHDFGRVAALVILLLPEFILMLSRISPDIYLDFTTAWSFIPNFQPVKIEVSLGFPQLVPNDQYLGR